MNLLEANAVSVSLGGRPVVDNVSLSVGAGEFVGLIGPNGAGKSTFLRACMGLVKARGQIRLHETALEDLRPDARARLVAYLPQDHEIAWPVSVRHVVSLGRQPWRDSNADAIVAQALERMEITALADRPANTLSGGERARVLIARALAQTTPLLLADEPAAGLDPAHQIGLMKTFRSFAESGSSVVCSLHDLGVAARWCSRLVVIERGRIVADDRPEAVLTAETLRRVYGVEAYIAHDGRGPVIMPVDLTGK